MNAPDLQALQRGDADAWDEAFRWLWPTAFAVAQLKPRPYLPEDIEDVAIEALEELVEKVRQIKEVEELKPLTAIIAHNRAVSRLRERFAAKRGLAATESLEARQEAGERFRTLQKNLAFRLTFPQTLNNHSRNDLVHESKNCCYTEKSRSRSTRKDRPKRAGAHGLQRNHGRSRR